MASLLTGTTIAGNVALHAANYSGYSLFSGQVSSSGNNGFANATWSAGVRNPIWYFGNATTYGISYFQGTAGIGSADTIGIHPNGTATAVGSAFSITPTASYVNNNVVLHAGNYTSYSPSLTGSGASGNWSINSANVTISNLNTQQVSISLAAGAWYTIAVNAGDRASAKFTITDTSSGLHQAIHFYATAHFGTDTGAKITVVSNTYYAGPPISAIRIMRGSTYDGAMVQIYALSACNLVVSIYDNQQSGGWVIKSGIVSTTNPGGVNVYGNLGTNAAAVDLTAGKSFSVADEIYIGGATTQYKALHANNYSSYALPLTGGTVSGVVRINNQLQVGQNTNGTAYIDAYGGYAWFGRDSNSTGIRIDGSANVHLTNTLNVVNAITQNGNQVLHAGNYTSYPDATKLPLAGGTMTGTIIGVSDTTLSFNGGTCTAASYNYILGGANDGGNKLVIFVNGSTRTADGGVNALTIRNDGGTFVLGQASYFTSILGSTVGLTGNTTVTGQLNVNNTTTTSILRLYSGGSTVWSLGVGDASGSYFNITADFGSFTINKTNGYVGIGTTSQTTRIQLGSGTPTSATDGIQFGDDTATRLYRSASGIVTCSGTIAATFSGNLTGNITGNASGSSTFVASLGSGLNYDNDRTVKRSGLSHYSGYSTGTNRPTTYDYTLQVTDGNKGWEISMDWIATTGPAIYARSLRDCCQNWSSWVRILDSANYSFAANMNQNVRSSDSPTFADLYTTGNLQIRNAAPTITFRDTNERTAYIHVNSNIFYVLTATADSAYGNWATVANGRWPMELNLSNNNATFGADVNAISFTGAGTGLTGTASSLSIGGNAATATTTDNINGRAFYNRDSGNALGQDSYTNNGIGYVNSVSLFGQTDGGIFTSAYSTSWIHQIFGDFRTGQIAIRGKNNGTWQSWRTVLDSSNSSFAYAMNQGVGTSNSPSFTGLTVTNTISGSVNGNAATATLATKASTLSQGGGNGTAMTFNWAGQSGQPTWLWGSNDGTNIYVWNPSNFNVNSAASVTGTVAIGNGGTGATTAANARTNLGIDARVRAWCHFDGTPPSATTLNANFNVSSVTKNATGDYTVNFTTAFANAYYTVAGTSQLDNVGQSNYNTFVAVPRRSGAQAAGSCRVVSEYPAGVALYDAVSFRVEFVAA